MTHHPRATPKDGRNRGGLTPLAVRSYIYSMGRRPNPDPTPAVDRLRRWLDLRDLSQVGLARALDVHEQLVYGWTSGRIRPSYEHAAALERLSGGIVPVAMWADPGETAAIADAALEKIDKKSA